MKPVLPFPIADAPDAQSLDAGYKLFRGEISFLKGVVAIDGLPAPDRTEFCFAGRSNVGKSSLINALTERKSLARTSSTPGRTQEINFFTLADSHYMVDLPGYGYAKAPPQTVKKWQALLKAYLSGRVNLRRVFLLIDARHGAKKEDDEIMARLDSSAVTFQVVMTKIDKPNQKELDVALEKTRALLQKHPAAYPEILTTSSEKSIGLDILRATIYKLGRDHE